VKQKLFSLTIPDPPREAPAMTMLLTPTTRLRWRQSEHGAWCEIEKAIGPPFRGWTATKQFYLKRAYVGALARWLAEAYHSSSEGTP
jgi:hypothetical protein